MTLTGPLGILTHLGAASAVTTLAVSPFFVVAALQPPSNAPLPSVQQIISGMPMPTSPAGVKPFVMYNFQVGVQFAQYIETQVKAALLSNPPPSTPSGSNGAL
ncbi:MAG TPA: hypothetical protein P5256_09650 [Beijerinckiaceae bacterium]|nr:hypothetical protein [Hyphomicrobiales bacterium]HRY03382.1 hypothetical protein [Beijerinckiaceae bacterium]